VYHFLKPKDLETSLEDPEAATAFKYWLATFETFLQAVEAGQAAINPDVEVNKKGLLVNLFSPVVYSYVEDCETYEEALVILKCVYVKRKSDVFARHLLATGKQRTAESLQQFLQALKLLSKDCTFQAVSAEQYREEIIRDTFINGQNFQGIRQRLLEKDDLSLEATYKQAYSLERAQQQSSIYSQPITASAAKPPQDRDAFEQHTAVPTSEDALTKDESAVAAVQKTKCFFCGGPYHLRRRCPTRNAECNECGKTGHFAEVCHSKSPNISAALLPEHYIASVVVALACLQSAVVDIEIQGVPVRALLDTGASDSYVDSEVAKRLGSECKGQSSSIALASTGSSAKVRRVVNCNISAFKGPYSLELGVVDNLCADVILGLDFLKMHRSTTFVTRGPRKPIRIGDQKVCSIAAANVKPPRIFQFLNPKVRPISIPSRRFNAEDSRFMTEEINKLLYRTF